MQYLRSCLSVFITLLSVTTTFSQTNFTWPETPSSKVFQDFIRAYNTGLQIEIKTFAKTHYANTDSAYLDEKTEYWMDIYHRFGPVKLHSLSINKPNDLEVWLQGTMSKAWFAPEFILNSDNQKIKAVGMLLGMQPPNTSTPAPSNEEFLDRLTNYLTLNEQHNLFQGSVLLAQHGKIIHSKAYGFKNIEENELNTLSTRFDIVSITKPITAIAILQLVQNGKLDLFAPIEKYLPELPKNISEKITIYQLLTHTSDYKLKNIDGFREQIEKTNSLKEVYDIHLEQLPKWDSFGDFNPSGKWNYSNQGYDLLGVIIEKVTGLNLEQYFKINVFETVGMSDTSFSKAGTANPYRYDLKHGGLKDYSEYPSFFGRVSAAAQLNSTVDDLYKLFETIKNTDDLLDEAHKGLLYAPLVKRGGDDFQGLGLEVNYESILNIGHSGVNVGNTSELIYFPESDLVLVVLCNNRSGAPNLYNFLKNNIPKK
ncbi:serine hydrolase domain-containing protein [Flagellimonas nanhaiensis]|uniref:Class A beta-lactamase-related serine hydrolase n=1 Tax=Flagellimonas nanhaiensis TaxID=2292706 RepID=A0A371JUM4_9FLAO|nr:serine hydrolase domain-containing protein [Allomuricauda nanhaiensis]RDY61489.1 class A beta-lactamase-related serine hydrolase [Allomuricauda nanhaiensis]